MQITSDLLHDEIDFLSSLLSQCAWVKGSLRKDPDIPIRRFLLQQLESSIEEMDSPQDSEPFVLSEDSRRRVISLLRIYCTILNTFTTKQEAQYILRLLGRIALDHEYVLSIH